MKFLFYIPGVQSVTQDLIERIGLAYATEVRSGGRSVSGGPDGGNGVIIGHDNESIGGYYPSSQTWVPAPQGDLESAPWWIGMPKDEPLDTESLLRGSPLPGKTVTFMDGSKWNVPILRQWHPSGSKEVLAVWSTPLPTMVDIDRYGKAIDGPVVKQYRDLFDISLRVISQMVGRGELVMNGSQLIAYAADILGINYRVSLFELSSKVLDCFSSEDAKAVVEAAIDWEGYLEAVKNWDGR